MRAAAREAGRLVQSARAQWDGARPAAGAGVRADKKAKAAVAGWWSSCVMKSDHHDATQVLIAASSPAQSAVGVACHSVLAHRPVT